VRNVFDPCKIHDGLERGGTLESGFFCFLFFSTAIFSISAMDYHIDKPFFFCFTLYSIRQGRIQWVIHIDHGTH
jgi:hypothetical protein